MFDNEVCRGVPFDSCSDSCIGFDILNHESGRRFAFVSEPFFMPWVYQFHLRVNKLVGWVRGASARWVCSCDQYVNSHSARLFPFDIGIGGYSQGANTMANQQNNSIQKTRQQLISDAAVALEIGCTTFTQLEALFKAISSESKEHSQIYELSNLGAYLAMDFGNLMDCDREKFQDMTNDNQAVTA